MNFRVAHHIAKKKYPNLLLSLGQYLYVSYSVRRVPDLLMGGGVLKLPEVDNSRRHPTTQRFARQGPLTRKFARNIQDRDLSRAISLSRTAFDSKRHLLFVLNVQCFANEFVLPSILHMVTPWCIQGGGRGGPIVVSNPVNICISPAL